ncbi:MAG: protein kinase [archaeon]|nr:protein kinase [archaeon]
MNNIKKIHPIGRGGFGRVWLIKMKGIQNFKANASKQDVIKFSPKYEFALKEMSKAKIVQRKSVESIRNERKFLEVLNHPLIINMQFAFESTENLYLILDFLSGGDLRYNLCKKKYYSEEQVKFIVACIVLVLENLRAKHIIHRDLKPENLVFDENGFIHITDFGIAYNTMEEMNITDSSGTPGYMAPEIFLHTPQDYSVDYFALGVITHELMLRRRPYSAIERKGYKEEVLTREVQLKKKDLPTQRGWQDESVIDFINGLLKRKPRERLGYNSISEIICHPWLSDVDWEGIYGKTITPPFSFESKENFDVEYANKKDDSDMDSEAEDHLNLANSKKYFRDYYFNRFEVKNEVGGRRMKKSQTTRRMSMVDGLSEAFKSTNHISSARKSSCDLKARRTTRRSTYANNIYKNLLQGAKADENKNEENNQNEQPQVLKLNENKINEGKPEEEAEIEKIDVRSRGASMKRKRKNRKSVLPMQINRNKILDDLNYNLDNNIEMQN